jgi:hypothetical protein
MPQVKRWNVDIKASHPCVIVLRQSNAVEHSKPKGLMGWLTKACASWVHVSTTHLGAVLSARLKGANQDPAGGVGSG